MSSDINPYQENDASQLTNELFNGQLSVEEALEKLRTRLLDLSMRNKLLNYRAPKGRSFQFVDDPNLESTYERLMDGKAVELKYVPDPQPERYEGDKKPDVRVYAKELGINTATESLYIAAAGTQSRPAALQVLRYPADLEKASRKLAAEARTAIEETGSNMLYLIFGFLQYQDKEDSGKLVQAPLIAMPTTLANGRLDNLSRTYVYELSHSGEDVAENFTLREKLRREFRLELPEFEESDTPETYIAKIEAAISNKPKWEVKRELCLGFLAFGKLAIWSDLDPKNSEGLLSSTLLKEIFAGGNSNSAASLHAPEYDIDSHPDGELPLIFDADSSQHSAIIDVHNGKNLVINGPPGTGKSQTITNIIATAMGAGKKVLFVSEKLAALEVVKHRLESAGLGDFCLELHSHKTQKKQLLEDLSTRLSKKYRKPIAYSQKLEVLRQRRNSLNFYASLLGSQLGNSLDLTVHEIFWITQSRRQSVKGSLQRLSGLRVNDAHVWDLVRLDKCRIALSDVSASMLALGGLPETCAWFGFSPKQLFKGDEIPIVLTAKQALASATKLHDNAEELAKLLETDKWSIQQIKDSIEIARILATAPDSAGSLLETMFPNGLASIALAESELKRLNELLSQVRSLVNSTQGVLCADLNEAESEVFTAIKGHVEVFHSSALNMKPREVAHVANQGFQKLDSLTSTIGHEHFRLPSDPHSVIATLQSFLGDTRFGKWIHRPVGVLARTAEEATAKLMSVRLTLSEVETLLASCNPPLSCNFQTLQTLLEGGNVPELLEHALLTDQTLELFVKLSRTSQSSWTAEQFSKNAQTITAFVATSQDALNGLRNLSSRLGIKVDSTKSSLDDFEALIALAIDAPKSLLRLRSESFNRQDFEEIVTSAETAANQVLGKQSLISKEFHLDMLPEQEQLKQHIRVLRQGGGLFSSFSSDWRQATAAFRGCTKRLSKTTPATMAELFTAALTWKNELNEFKDNPLFISAIGSSFQGIKTDFLAIRRLHKWLKSGSLDLMTRELGHAVSLVTIQEDHLALLEANAQRISSWMQDIRALSQSAVNLPNCDLSLRSIGRVEDLFDPLFEYAKTQAAYADTISKAVRANVSVSRALEVLDLQRKVTANKALLETLIQAPSQLAEVAASLGYSVTPSMYYEIKKSLNDLSVEISAAETLSQLVMNYFPEQENAQKAHEKLSQMASFERHIASLLPPYQSPASVQSKEWLEARRSQLNAVLSLAQFLEHYAGEGSALKATVHAIQVRLDADRFIENIQRDRSFQQSFGEYLRGVDSDEQLFTECVSWAKNVALICKLMPSNCGARLLSRDTPAIASQAASLLQSARENLDKYSEHMRSLDSWGTLDWMNWEGHPFPSDAVEKLNRALREKNKLVPLSKYLSAWQEASSVGAAKLLAKFSAGDIPPEQLVAAFEYIFYGSLARTVLAEQPILARFSGPSHEKLRDEFTHLDKQIIKLNGEIHAASIDTNKQLLAGISNGRAGDLSELALIDREIGKQKRHIPIRQLLKRAGKTLLELKPCFMMGPLSVAQYLELGTLQFDLIVMDEASQLRPEDALGAIARGKQLVVVGDPKQLPPSAFFNRLMEDDGDDPDENPSIVDGVESILGICEHLYRPVRTLRWHYRSQHESLIAFSNTHFYDSRLIVFPSPHKKSTKLGVNYRYVRDGAYADRRNVREAERVVDAIVMHMLTDPHESLGVVTMNQSQRELIEDLLDKRLRNVPESSQYLERHKAEGWAFFVKNLENVQGDERDVIFVSTTFGRPPDRSPVRQAFGPINQSDGWRRLNVLFTRARKRIDLYTSLLPSDIVLNEKASLGRRALREYLEFAQSGVLSRAKAELSGLEPDSDFEVAVSEALMARGYGIAKQVGVAGYYIDLAVEHPERDGEFLAGIECDGVTYHSSLSARDRDRIRQTVLESLGWRNRLIRIWSTDWFADPEGQVERIVVFLENLRIDDRKLPIQVLEKIDNDWTEQEIDRQSDDTQALQITSLSTQEFSSDELNENSIEVKADVFADIGDRISYETMIEPFEKHSVQIVDSASNARLGLINDQTPLAQALLGGCVGDIVKLIIPHRSPIELRIIEIESM